MECADTDRRSKIRIHECITVQKVVDDKLEDLPCISRFEITYLSLSLFDLSSSLMTTLLIWNWFNN